MELRIFDVSHGFCALLIADNNNLMLFDCGHNQQTGFRPSDYLQKMGCNGIEYLIVQNFDQDHVSDLPNVLKLGVGEFFRNRSLTPEQMKSMKLQSGPLTTAMASAIQLHADAIHHHPNPPVFPNIEFVTFYNEYPTFTDTNNLSLISFIFYDGMGIVFPGDLETAGWLELLKKPTFRSHLSNTSIFIASHHGRTTGYCADVFKYCHPDIVLISDKEIVHDTQQQDYATHASGLLWEGGPKRRFVLTTRKDGMIKLTKSIGEGYHISVG